MVEARRSIIILVDKQAKVAKIIKIAIPGDARVKDKEMEKIEKYQFLREEIGKLWKMKKVTVGPIVLGHLELYTLCLGNTRESLKLPSDLK